MNRLLVKGLFVLLCLLLFGMVAPPTYAASKAPLISKEELKKMLDEPAITIIDVRAEGAWESADLKIKGAVREDPDRVEDWARKYPKDKSIVLYCS